MDLCCLTLYLVSYFHVRPRNDLLLRRNTFLDNVITMNFPSKLINQLNKEENGFTK